MTLLTKPNLLEAADLRGGWVPDIEDAAQPDDTLQDVLNLLPRKNSPALSTRKGFTRLILAPVLPATHSAIQVFPFNPEGASKRLIVVMSTGGAGPDNVQLWVVDVSALTSARIDTIGREWTNPLRLHWGMSVDGVWYGGEKGEEMYSWDPVTDTWDLTAAADPSIKDWVNAVDGDVDTTTEFARDYAWRGKEQVLYSGKAYSPTKRIRYPKWENSQEWYAKGERVSRKADWPGPPSGSTYWKSFKCIKAHAPTAALRPGDGSGAWTTYWKKVRFDSPSDEDGNVNKHWQLLNIDPTAAAKSGIAAWFAQRMWLRYDGTQDRSRVQYSTAVKMREGDEISNVTWDPTDWAPSLDDDGGGGGWWNFNDGRYHGEVSALWPYGQSLLVFKRQACWILSGQSEETFTVRQLASGVGCLNTRSICEHDGLVYFADEDALRVTDGTQVEAVPGMDKVRKFWRDRVSAVQAADDNTQAVSVWSFDDYIWVSFPVDGDETPFKTLVYYPPTSSWWLTDLPVYDSAVTPVEKTARMYFVSSDMYGAGNFVYEYNADDTDEDDEGFATLSTTPVAWLAKTAWWGFGTLHQERRVRRVWAVVKGVMTFTLSLFRDWAADAAKTTTRDVTGSSTAYIEGEVVPDSHAVAVEVSGPSAPATLYSVAVLTEPRRVRYGRGG